MIKKILITFILSSALGFIVTYAVLSIIHPHKNIVKVCAVTDNKGHWAAKLDFSNRGINMYSTTEFNSKEEALRFGENWKEGYLKEENLEEIHSHWKPDCD